MRRISAFVVVLAAFAVAPASASALTAGVAKVDITPENGGTTLGFVRPDIAVKGVHTRLTGRVLVLDDGDTKVALLATDLAFALDKESLVARVQDLGFTHETILYTGTHTHSGPESLASWQVEQLARAIREAHAKRVPAVAGWASGAVKDVARNRSIEAHLANHGIDQFYGEGHPDDDPEGEDHTTDDTLRVLRVQTPKGKPLAAWLNFPVHLTTSTPKVNLWDSDLAASAVHNLEAALPGAIALYNNGTLGDLMPRFDSYNPTAVMDLHGRRIAAQAVKAWKQAGKKLRPDLPVDVRWTRTCYCGQEVGDGHRVDDKPLWGLPFLGGSEDGASIFHDPLATEGRRLPPEAADPVNGRKIIAAPGIVHEAEPEVQVIRIGDRMLLAAPGEPSVEMGRRFQAAVRDLLPAGVREAFLVSLANDYMGYFTTPEEYEMQHYEGGHTVFGIYTSWLVRNTFQDLVRAMASGGKAPDPSTPGGLGGTDTPAPAVGDGGVAGELLSQPPEQVERMTTLEISWKGAAGGVDRPLDAPFVTLERADGTVVDSDLGLAFLWAEEDGTYTARYDIGPEIAAGAYRLRVKSGSYDLTTREFALQRSNGLRVLGATARRARRGTRIVIHAQNPAPDPARAILWRPQSPAGGRAAVRVRGKRYVARWSPKAGGWAVTVPRRLRPGTPLTIAAGGLRDGAGNVNGDAAQLSLGTVAALEWPTNMGVGGGRTPGPFGEGSFPP